MLHQLLDLIKPEYLLQTYGVAVVFLILFAETGLMCFFLPGDSLIVTAGFFCALGKLGITNIWVLMAGMIIMTILGDTTGYFIGNRIGVALYNKPDTWYFKQKYISQTREFYDKYGNLAIVVGKFVPIVRSMVPVLAGVGELSYRRYIVYSCAGACCWVISMGLLGYFLLQLAAYLGFSKEQVSSSLHLIIISVIFLSFIPPVVGAIRARLNKPELPQ